MKVYRNIQKLQQYLNKKTILTEESHSITQQQTKRDYSSYRDLKKIQENAQRKVFGWGAGGEFQLATEFPHDAVSSPTEIASLRGQKVCQVSTGWVTSFALTEDGRVFGWGSNRSFQLLRSKNPSGFTHQFENNTNNNNNNHNDQQQQESDPISDDRVDTHYKSPVLLPFPWKIKKVAAARAHAAFLDLDGNVYTVGSNELGQIGDGHDGEGLYREQLYHVAGELEGVTVKDIQVGLDHTLALSSKGEVYAWGIAAEGQLGIGDDASLEVCNVPRKISYEAYGNELPRIAKIYAGSDHTGLITTEGELYVCGSNVANQLGIGSNQEFEAALYPIRLDGELKGKKIVDASFGGYHSFAITDRGEVYVWGWNQEGKLGLPKSVPEVARPLLHESLTALKPKMIRTGGGSTVVVTKSDQFYTFGIGENGRLCQGSSQLSTLYEPTPIRLLNEPRLFSRIIDLNVGIDHCLLVVE